MSNRITLIVFMSLMASTVAFAQNTNSSTTTERPRTSRRPPAKRDQPTETATPATPTQAAKPTQNKPVTSTTQTPGSAAVLAAFESLLNGIRKSNVKMVTDVYWNSPRLVLFNNNGTVTKGWDQMRKNRESSYPEIKDVKLDVRDVSVTMLGNDGAVVTALWTQSQTYKDAPETATGRMTIVFRRFGKDWKAIHLHTSPDKPDPSRILPSEQPTAPSPTPTPPSPTPTPSPSPTPPGF